MKASRHAEKAAEFVRIITKVNKEITQEELSIKLGYYSGSDKYMGSKEIGTIGRFGAETQGFIPRVR